MNALWNSLAPNYVAGSIGRVRPGRRSDRETVLALSSVSQLSALLLMLWRILSPLATFLAASAESDRVAGLTARRYWPCPRCRSYLPYYECFGEFSRLRLRSWQHRQTYRCRSYLTYYEYFGGFSRPRLRCRRQVVIPDQHEMRSSFHAGHCCSSLSRCVGQDLRMPANCPSERSAPHLRPQMQRGIQRRGQREDSGRCGEEVNAVDPPILRPLLRHVELVP